MVVLPAIAAMLTALSERFRKLEKLREDGQNGLGLHDMSGNIWELCQDWYGEYYYADSPRDNPLGADIGEERVVRGGTFQHDDFVAVTTFRASTEPKKGCNSWYGFRLVLPAK